MPSLPPTPAEIVLRTERLVLRRLRPSDGAALAEVLSDPVAMRFYPAPFDRPAVAAWIRSAMRGYLERGFGLWAVVRADDGRFLGDCAPTLQPVEGQPLPEIGYHIVPAEQGKGYATEAAAACLDWTFRETAHERVVSIVAPGNRASRRVAERIHARSRRSVWERSGSPAILYETT